ncbi:hypothetical protein AGLY_008032 [Aphis glycines]|uniref:Uncharacterized protein n=1 Tax=Aphis glycines TaxID=307491 RepID=A0A6G0TMY3_APHGL|nr:hypothetical protein AGLY_008032 [Aphis glycines]
MIIVTASAIMLITAVIEFIMVSVCMFASSAGVAIAVVAVIAYTVYGRINRAVNLMHLHVILLHLIKKWIRPKFVLTYFNEEEFYFIIIAHTCIYLLSPSEMYNRKFTSSRTNVVLISLLIIKHKSKNIIFVCTYVFIIFQLPSHLRKQQAWLLLRLLKSVRWYFSVVACPI